MKSFFNVIFLMFLIFLLCKIYISDDASDISIQPVAETEVKKEKLSKDLADVSKSTVEEPEVKKDDLSKYLTKAFPKHFKKRSRKKFKIYTLEDKTDKPVQSGEESEVKKEEVKKEEVKKDKTDKPVQSVEEPEVKKEEVKKEEILEEMPNASLQPIKKPRTYSLKELRKMCLQYAPKPEVEINFSANKIKYSHKYSIEELTRRLNRRISKGSIVAGLTYNRVDRSIDFDVEVPNPKGFLFCAYPANIKLNLTLDQEILIAKEVKKGTCLYARVVRHEQTHAQIARTAVEHYLPIIGKRFIEVVRKNAIAGRTSPIYPWRARAELHEKYYDIIDLLIKELYKKIDKEDAKLDNDKNYRYEDKLCW